MLKGPNPLLSIRLITTLGLYPHIFTIPPTKADPPHPVLDALTASEILSSLLPGGKVASLIPPSLVEKVNGAEGAKEREKMLWLACTMAPFRGGTMKDKKKDVMMAEIVVRDGLKVRCTDMGYPLRLS